MRLGNKEAERDMKITFNDKSLHFYSESKYLRVTLDRTLKYRRQFDSFQKKLTSRVAILRRLAGFG